MLLLDTTTLSLPGVGAFLALTMGSILPAVLTLVCGVLIVRVIMKLVDKSLARTRMEKVAVSLVRSVLKVVLYLLVGLMVASRLGVDVTGLVAVASVASLALSLSLQDALSNIIGGFTLLSTHPFRSGDYVEIAGQAGTVQSIDITYTKLTTPDNKTISIPNSAVVASQVVNYSTTGTRRLDIDIRVDYGTDAQTVKEALLSAAAAPTVINEPAAPLAAIRSYGESNVEYTLQVWTTSADYWTTLYRVNENIQEEFQRAGIAMAFPHMNVHLDK